VILRSDPGRGLRPSGELLLTQICMAKAVGFGGEERFRDDEIKKLQTDTETMHEMLATIAGQTGNIRIGAFEEASARTIRWWARLAFLD
jgi:hypothetical protein